MGNLIFDANYIRWKSWSSKGLDSRFGSYATYQASYFSKILRLLKISKKGPKVLEVGFGNGGFLAYCQKAGLDITGTELNSQLLAVASSAGFSVFDERYLNQAPQDTFDVIAAFDFLDHIPPEQTIAFLESCKRLLNSEGSLVLRFPNGDSPASLPVFHGDATHLNWIGSGKMRYYAQCAGFSQCSIRGTPEIIITKSIKHGLHNLIVVPLKQCLNLILGFFLYPGRRLNLISVDLLVILRKKSMAIPMDLPFVLSLRSIRF